MNTDQHSQPPTAEQSALGPRPCSVWLIDDEWFAADFPNLPMRKIAVRVHSIDNSRLDMVRVIVIARKLSGWVWKHILLSQWNERAEPNGMALARAWAETANEATDTQNENKH